MGIRRRAAAGIGTLLAALGVLGAFPQDDPPRRRIEVEIPVPLQEPDDDGPPPEPRNTVLLRACPDADQLTIRVPALVQAGNYAEALAIFEKALREHPDAVIPLDSARARGLAGYVLDLIGAWPEEGREVYRRATDPVARRLFEAARGAGDAAALEDLVEQYPYPSIVGDALSLAAGLRLDAGQPAGAAADLERLLALEGDAPRPVTLARLGLASARAGRKGRVEELAGRAARDLPGATARIGGEDRDLAGFLGGLARDAREAAPPAAAALAIPSWEMMGGHPSGSRLAEPRVEASRLAWTWPLRPAPFGHEGLTYPMPMRGYVPMPSGEFRPFFPAVSDGVLYVHNETAVAALNLFARRPQVLWQHSLPDPGGEIMFEDRVIHAATVHEGRVFVNLMTAVERPDDQLSYVRVKFPFPRRALFAFDAAGGQLLWKLGGVLRSDRLEENATFSAPPTPEGDRLYVGAVKQKLSTDPFEHYVLCLDAATGKILWRTFVASGGTEINLFGNSTRESLGTPVAVTGDAVFYGTHHGAVAALEKKGGRIRWIHRYAQLPVRPTRSIAVSKNRLGWVNSPPVVAEGVVAVTPMDAPAAYGLDVRTGELRWARPRAMEVRTMYGVRGATLVLGGEGLEFVDIRTGKLLAMTGPELRGTGRGAVAEDGVYVPAADGLRRVGWDGAWENRPSGGWGGGRPRGGNLTVIDGAVILAAHDGIDVYFDRREPDKGVVAELEKEPDSPAALYRGALRMLQAGAAAEAEKLFARVAERKEVRPEDAAIVLAARKRLYAVRLESGRTMLEAKAFREAAEFFERARDSAPDPASRAEASLLLGRARVAGGDLRQGIREFQGLLAEGREESADGGRISDLARQEIDQVFKAGGREAYAPFEEEARAALEKAGRGKAAEAFLEVHRSWPNSRAAEEALLGAAAAHAGQGRADEEIGTLRQFLREYGGSPRIPEAYARLVLALERKGQKDGVTALLRRMVTDFPDAEVGDEGAARVKVRDFAERRLRSETSGRASSGPRVAFSPPLRKVLDYVDPDGRAGVAIEAGGTPPASASDLLLVNTGVAVKALKLSDGAERWRHRDPSGIQFAAYLEDSLLLAGERNVVRLDLRDGRVEWQYVSATPMRGFLLAGGTLCYLGTDPRVVTLPVISAIDTTKGKVAWTQPFQGIRKASSDGTMLRAAGEGVAFITLNPYQIHLYDRETGRKLMTKASFTPDPAAELEYASESLAVISSRGRFVEAYTLPGGALKWRSGMSSFSFRDLKVVAGKVVIVGAVDLPGAFPPEATLLVLDLENGKILRMKNKADLGDVRFMQVDGDTAFFVSRERDRTLAARAVRLEDLSVQWKTGLEIQDATAFPLVVAKEHVAVMTFGRGVTGKFFYDGSLLDRAGKVVQNIRSEPAFERPPHVTVANDRVVFSVDNRVEVYR